MAALRISRRFTILSSDLIKSVPEKDTIHLTSQHRARLSERFLSVSSRFAASIRLGSTMSPPPLIVILGTTGTGKSDLAVSIARQFDGEVINGDAVQMYSGLPIVTNKISVEEQQGVPHHFLGVVPLDEEAWTVGKFVKEACKLINDIYSRGKVPIVVGGTHYYIQSLLFRDSLNDEVEKCDTAIVGEVGAKADTQGDGNPKPEQTLPSSPSFSILDASTSEILAELQRVDPIMAARWHPNDRRKIQRSLEIYLTTGKPASEVYREQKILRQGDKSRDGIGGGEPDGEDGSTIDKDKEIEMGSNRLRFPTLVLWPYVPLSVLYPRLEKRVEKMLDRGLLAEVEQLEATKRSIEKSRSKAVITNRNRDMTTQKPKDEEVDVTRGIWVSIGYKEFLPYTLALKQQSQISDGDKEERTAVITALLKEGIEKTKSGTRQYAKRQLRWLRIKFLNAILHETALGIEPATAAVANTTADNTQEDSALEKIISQGQVASIGTIPTSPSAYLYILPYEQTDRFSLDVIPHAHQLASTFLRLYSNLHPTLSRSFLENTPTQTMPPATSLPILTPETLSLLGTTPQPDLSRRTDLWERQECKVCGVVTLIENEWQKHIRGRVHRAMVRKEERGERYLPLTGDINGAQQDWIKQMKEQGRKRKEAQRAKMTEDTKQEGDNTED